MIENGTSPWSAPTNSWSAARVVARLGRRSWPWSPPSDPDPIDGGPTLVGPHVAGCWALTFLGAAGDSTPNHSITRRPHAVRDGAELCLVRPGPCVVCDIAA